VSGRATRRARQRTGDDQHDAERQEAQVVEHFVRARAHVVHAEQLVVDDPVHETAETEPEDDRGPVHRSSTARWAAA
jgi:hypothetical protein